MCKNLAVSDWVLVLAHEMPLIVVLVLNVADGEKGGGGKGQGK